MLDALMRKKLSNLNVINWIDFYSWKRDYDLGQMHELYQWATAQDTQIWVESARQLRK